MKSHRWQHQHTKVQKSSCLSSHHSSSHIRPRREASVIDFRRASREKLVRFGGESLGHGDYRDELQSTYRGGEKRDAGREA
uniref:Uncharacterized protein n=1 Tax=Brassica oleracea TaxID=3712 RepID=A0A3P6FKU3_BRAOL|nr:unnamed protein product [Brassica oleracea]